MNYIPEFPPNDIADGLKYAYEELQKISAAINAATMREVEFLSVEPSKPREGMVYGADGTFWNPGSGKGIYVYYSGTWNKLG